jgi:hypothetical protein
MSSRQSTAFAWRASSIRSYGRCGVRLRLTVSTQFPSVCHTRPRAKRVSAASMAPLQSQRRPAILLDVARERRGFPRCVLRVVGMVSLSGTVVRSGSGWRAEYAYPRDLWVTADELAQAGVSATWLENALIGYDAHLTVAEDPIADMLSISFQELDLPSMHRAFGRQSDVPDSLVGGPARGGEPGVAAAVKGAIIRVAFMRQLGSIRG